MFEKKTWVNRQSEHPARRRLESKACGVTEIAVLHVQFQRVEVHYQLNGTHMTDHYLCLSQLHIFNLQIIN